MSSHKATIHWQREGDGFTAGKYSREHLWTFDGGFRMPASPSPSVVPTPFSNPACVDPEEAFVAAIASCHMLTFLYLASRKGFVVDRYEDAAEGVMTPNERGVPWVSTVRLRPKIVYSGGDLPNAAAEAELHHQAHEQCFIANSVKTIITVDQTTV